MGHTYAWMSDKYYWAVNYIFDNVARVLSVLPEEYVVIITSDHGGGGGYGDKSHGSSQEVDMTIPFFIIGDEYECGRVLNEISILDVAPTVADILEVEAECYWSGNSVRKKIENT